MKRNVARALAVLAVVVLGLVLPGCETTGDVYSTTYVGVGYGVYGGYSTAGWGSCCFGPAGGGIVAHPPVGGGAYPMPH
ncbi:MAG: hypothetical protein DYH06_20115 [Acidobacteria bacterium ACB2]|nr:hypothetical protein [Acidobacteria bacterium ACB2]